MTILEELYGTAPVDLNNYIETNPLPPLAPEASVRNRAASTALLSDNPEKLVENYQAIILEAEQGLTTTQDQILKEDEAAYKPQEMKEILGILGDNSLDMIAKTAAIKAINSGFYKDTSTRIATNAAIAPSETPLGSESVEQEDVRVFGAANQLKELFDYREAVQAMRNKHGASLNADTGTALADFVEVVAPFATNVRSAKLLKDLAVELRTGNTGVLGTVFAGNRMSGIREALANMPPSERIKVLEPIKSIVEANSGIIFRNDNDFNEWMTMNQVFDEGGYSGVDKFLDNAAGVLDIVGLGGAAKAIMNKATKLFKRTPVTVEANINRSAITGNVQPSAPANIVAEVNPDKARNMYSLVVKSEGDEASKALYGVNREEAITQQVVPQIDSVDGSVPARVMQIDRKVDKVIEPDAEVVEAFYDDGAIYLTPGEKEAARAARVTDFFNAKGLMVNDAMTRISSLDGGRVSIKGVFGNTEGGFALPEQAIEQAKLALRDFGITENNLTIMKRIDGEYAPVSLDEVKGVKGDYYVQVETQYQINPSDITNMEAFDVKWKLFARVPHSFWGVFGKNSGGLNRWVFDAQSMFRKELAGGASVASDRAVRVDKAILKLHDSFAKKYTSLPGDKQKVLFDHIKEANFKGLELNDVDLMAQGFTPDMMTALKDWRKAWDTHFWLENADLIRSMRIQGFQLFENANARFLVKPAAKNKNIGRVYDPSDDSIKHLDEAQLDDLYNNGGHYGRLRRPVEIDGHQIEHIIVRNKPDEYARALNDNDQVLNYRKGYYQLQYTAPKFLEKIVRNADGSEAYRKVVAYGENTRDVELLRTRLAAQEGISPDQYGRVRGDINEVALNSDAYWDMQSTSGRIAQRHRGKLLEDASAPINASHGEGVLDPVESAIRAARNLSGRVATRSFLETSKHRALRQYEEFFPKTPWGEPMWVDNVDKLVYKGNSTTEQAAAARSTVEYLNYLENGYINSLDAYYKAGMNAVGNFFAKFTGSKVAAKAEEAAYWAGEVAPFALGKQAAFHAYIGTNPIRQWILQPHGGLRLAAYNPKYVLGGSWAKDVSLFVDGVVNPNASKQAKELVKWIDDTGLLSSVDRHNLVRGSLAQMVDSTSKFKRYGGHLLAAPRKVGFDIAEQMNLLNHLLTVRDKYIRAGKKVTDVAVRDEIMAEARAISYSMNFANDMPYNQNWASLFMQFAQVPHKAILNYTNRAIPWKDRLKLAGADILMFGPPAGLAINSLIPESHLPQEHEARRVIVDGVTTELYNRVLSEIAGEDVELDWSGLSPFEMDGWAKLGAAMWTGGWSDIFTNSPAANLFFKEDARFKQAIVSIGRYVGYFDPNEGHEPAEVKDALDSVASISSGWTNWQKAKLIYESGRIVDKKGKLLSEDASFMYAVAQAFGFASAEQARFYAASKEITSFKKEFKDDVNKWYNTYIQELNRKYHMESTDKEFHTKVLGMARLVYHDNPEAMKLINSNLERDVLANDARIIRDALKAANIKGAKEAFKETERYMANDERKRTVWQMINDINRKVEGEAE